MFELNGNAIGLEDIQKKAKEKGYNVDEYINFLKEKGLVEKTEGAVANDATVVPQTPDTDLASADTSSEQPKTKLWGGLVPIEVNEVNDKQFNRDGGFFEDLVVAARQGTKTGQSVEEAWDVYRQGKSISDEQLQGAR